MKKKGAYTRYSFLKKLYPDRLIIIKLKNKYISFGKDNILLNYLLNTNKFSILDNIEVNYLIITDMYIIKEKTPSSNQYYKYVKISQLNSILTRLNNSVKNRVNL